MTITISGRIPPGPAQAYDPGQDLLGWMELNLHAGAADQQLVVGSQNQPLGESPRP